MVANWKVWAVRSGICLATGFGVFVLPFLFPSPYFFGVSASNLAGFNNRLSALTAAGMAFAVFWLAVNWPQFAGSTEMEEPVGKQGIVQGHLSRRLVGIIAAVWAAALFEFGNQIIRSGATFKHDWGYFINRASMHADFGRKLYTQIEYPYGPLLFYGPVAIKALLSPLHASMADAYLATLIVETVIGLLLVAYVIDHLPLSRGWKAAAFMLMAVGMFVGNMGVNYTFFRFATPLALLVVTSQRKRVWAAALWLFAGQAICLGLSPEIGFAFFVGAFSLAACGSLMRGWMWGWEVTGPILSATIFIMLAGQPYLNMLNSFSRGLYNLPVEPLPQVLLFLLACVWLVPVRLARYFSLRKPESPMFISMFAVSLALLPAAFGRADPGHVFWNGLSVFLLSIVAISFHRRWQQIAWGSSLAILFLWMCSINKEVNWPQLRPIVHQEASLLPLFCADDSS